jgi:hypothetical protein
VTIAPPGSITQKQDLILFAIKAYSLEEAVKSTLLTFYEESILGGRFQRSQEYAKIKCTVKNHHNYSLRKPYIPETR